MKLVFLLTLLCSFSFAQNLKPVAEADIKHEGGSIAVNINGRVYHYLSGIGWLEDFGSFRLKLIDGRVYREEIDKSPKLLKIRYGRLFGNRIVLDFQGLSSDDLSYLRASGTVRSDEVLEIKLPRLEHAENLIKDFDYLNQELEDVGENTIFKLFGDDFQYRIFTLSKPTRLVIDFKKVFIAIDREVRPGVIQRRFKAQNSKYESVVNMLEIDPRTGRFELAEALDRGDKLANMATRGFAAINAGYFDTSNFKTIGFLKIDGNTLNLPSRNRACLAFDKQHFIIDRVQTEVELKLNAKSFFASLPDQEADIQLFTYPATIDPQDKALILVKDSRVISNAFSPQTVPENGFAILYRPIIPDLLAARAGDSASYSLKILPKDFALLDNAVEAGPLLLKDFVDVYQPGLEHFQTGVKILDSYTQQAAIGLKENGNVILLVADKMRAAELIPVLQELGAKDAMRLDSGSSAALYLDGKLLNTFNGRKIVTALIFRPD